MVSETSKIESSYLCPDCGMECERIEVDVGPGNQVGPWECYFCGWTQTDAVNMFIENAVFDLE